MKTKLTTVMLLLFAICITAHAQAPLGVPYQAVARDNGGNLISNQNISVRFSIHNGAAAGPVVYSETHNVSTNALGLFTLNVGQGTPVSGTMAGVNWSSGTKFLQVEMDPAGGSSYVNMGTTQMMSVPYALHAGSAANFDETDPQVSSTSSNQVPKWNGSTLLDGIITDNGTNIGIGTSSPSDKLEVVANGTTGYTGGIVLHAPNMTSGQTAISFGKNTVQGNRAELRFEYYGNFNPNNGYHFGFSAIQPFMSITAGQRVGIGTLSPSEKLDVIGKTKTTNFQMTSGTPASGKVLTAIDASGNATWQTPAVQAEVDPQVSSAVSNQVPKWNGTTLTDGIITDNGSSVGIGTATPSTLFPGNLALEIEGDVPQILLDDETGSYQEDFRIQNGGYYASFDHANTNTPMMAFDMVVNPGYVGIGTVAPSQKLDIDGQIRIRGGAPAVGKILTSGADGTATWENPAVQAEVDPQVNSVATHRVPRWDGTSLVDGIISDNGSNVGIGVNYPTARLELKQNGYNWYNGMQIKADANAWGLYTDSYNSDNFKIAFNSSAKFTIHGISGNIGIGTIIPTQKLDIDGQIRIRGGAPGVGKVLTSAADGTASWQTPATGSSISGTTDYVVKFTGANTGGNSLIRDNGTSIGINAAPAGQYLLQTVRTQLTAAGDGQATIFGYRTRDSQNDGTGYTNAAINSAVQGYNYWGDLYTFGVAGHSFNDYTRTGGVLGAYYSGAYWGSLGYKSSGFLNYGVYGTSGYASGAGRYASGSADGERTGVGIGAAGDLMGGWVKGEMMGLVSSGSMFAAYNLGNVITSGRQIELVETSAGNRIAAYSNTSSESKVYSDGAATLSNGRARVEFDANFKAMIKSGQNPVITISPTGGWANMYIESVDNNGFNVVEANGAISNTSFNWIAIGKRVGEPVQISSQIMDPEFDSKLQQMMFNENDLENSGTSIWSSDGTTLRYDAIPVKVSNKTERSVE